MSLMQEIEKLMNSENASIDYRIINLGGNNLHIEGVKSIINLSNSEMFFQLKKTAILVSGRDLKIKYLDENSCVIAGKILKVECK